MPRALVSPALLYLFIIVDTSNAANHAHSVTTGKGSATEKQKDAVIQKVIDMLEENRGNIKADLQRESKDMADYMEYCDDEQSEKGYAIKTATRQIGDLSALIEDRAAQIVYLEEEIAKLGTELAERHGEVKEAEDLRKKESDEFKTAEKEMQLMIDELEKMEIEVKQQMQAMTTPPPVPEDAAPAEATPEGAFLAALMQVTKGKAKKGGPQELDAGTLQAAMSKMVNAVWTDPQSQKALGVVKGFVQNGQAEEPAAEEGPTPPPNVEVSSEALANFQESAANNLQAFETLQGKAQESLEKARNEELMAQHNHQLRMQSLTEAINIAEDKVSDYKQEKTRLGEEKGKAEGQVADAKETKSADMEYLATLNLECSKTSKQWDARQKAAKEEMAAISKAKEILAERVTVMMQDKVEDGPDASQVQNDAKVRGLLINHFRKLGSQLHSLAMLNLVSVSSSEPLGQVKKLLSDLMAKLEKEATEAASVHQFCKEEKAKTTAAKEKQIGVLDKVQSRLDAAKAQKEALQDSIAELSEELAAIDQADSEATKIRNEEHATYQKVVTDFKQAADAVEDALGALKDFYGDSSLVQTNSATTIAVGRQAPPKFGGSQAASGGGVISILETMQTEFMKTVATAESEEREAVKAYEKQINENKVSKATKTAESKGADSEIKSLAVAIQDLTEDHKMASKELDSVMQYIEKLKPQCEGRATPYEERKARREAEIAGLKEALAIITSSSLVQTRNTFLHHF